MNIYTHFEQCIKKAVQSVVDTAEFSNLLDRISVEPPRDPAHGDLSTNAAMVLAKGAKMSPRDLAGKLEPELAAVDGVDSVSVAGPGFINLKLKPEFWQCHLAEILEQGANYGRGNAR